MAELATIARPYAEALFKASANGDAATLAGEVRALADVAANPQLRLFADSPKIDATQVFDLLTGVAGTPSGAPLSDAAKNLLRTVIDNGRLVALPEIATQFQALSTRVRGVSQATIDSAFPIDATQVADVKAAMERRFAQEARDERRHRPRADRRRSRRRRRRGARHLDPSPSRADEGGAHAA